MSETDNLSLAKKVFGKPLTRTGWWAIRLALSFLVLFVLLSMWGHRAGNPRAGFRAYPLMAVLVIATAACGIATGLASGIGIFVKRERSLLLFLTFLLEACVLLFAGGELFEGSARH